MINTVCLVCFVFLVKYHLNVVGRKEIKVRAIVFVWGYW